MVKIIAPRRDYTGISASVQFVNGIGETDNKRLIDWFKKNGYDIKPEDDIKPTEDSDSKAESTGAETKTKKSNPNREK